MGGAPSGKMVVCKFFRDGYCRNGETCRFEHSYNSKYTYHAPSRPAPPPTPASSDAIEKIIAKVPDEVRATVNGQQWLLTCYAPFSRKNLPGFVDVSPEEARLAVYEAKAGNTVDQAIAEFNGMVLEVKDKYRKLLQPNTAILNTLRSLYNQEPVQSPFEASTTTAFGVSNPSVFGGQSSASVFGGQNQSPSSVFGGQSTASSVFGGQNSSPSVFGGQNSQPSPQSVFGAQNNPSPQSVFGAQNNASPQSVFGAQSNVASPQSVFGSTSPQSVFGAQTAASPQTVFGMQPNIPSPQSVFGAQNIPNPQSVFGASNNQTSAQSIFGQHTNSVSPQSVFGSQTSQQPNVFATSTPFGTNQDVFSKPVDVFQQNSPQSPFGSSTQAQSVFSQSLSSQPAFGKSVVDVTAYCTVEELSADYLEQFNSDKFEFGFIPELPPPQALCF